MCGITGILYYDRSEEVKKSTLAKMTNAVMHRGPDDEGYYINKNVGLGFRRLSIIDLNTGHQPLSNKDNSLQIVFNGEIYNFIENRDFLIKKGYSFKTTTDTEVILNLYEEYGTECLRFLRGMFSFAIWDNNKQQLFCARDRFGIKPFYYYSDNQKFVFGSEIKSILQMENIDKGLCYEALDSYFAYGYITSNLSIYKKIKKLLPSNYLVLDFSNGILLKTNSYWNIQFEPDNSKSENQWIEEMEYCLDESVRQHMISDVPIGAFLSGGIDSSSVVALMAKNSSRSIKTYSIGFNEQKHNELEYARELASKYNCEFHEQIIEPESIALLPKLVGAYDEPFADSSAIPTYYVSKFAREHVTVALSGDGGDELFAGYGMYKYFQNVYKYNSNSPFINKHCWGNLNRLLPQTMVGKGLTYYLSQNKNHVGAYYCMWTKQERDRLFLFNDELSLYNRPELYKEQIIKQSNSQDFVTNLQYLDLLTYLSDDILVKVDRVSMLNSLEVRVPLLDHKFAELTFKIPIEFKYNGKVQKYILKKTMEEKLPQNILNHGKHGFSIPLSKWFKDDFEEYVNEVLFSDNSLLFNYLNKSYINKIVGYSKISKRNFGYKLWSLLFFEEWLKQNN